MEVKGVKVGTSNMVLRPLPCRMHWNKYLPYQVLAEIFDYLHPSEQQKLRSVCKTWNLVTTKLFEVTYSPLDYGRWEKILKSTARFINVKIRLQPSALLSIDKFETFNSFCARLQKLEFSVIDFNLSCMKILQSAHSLKELCFRSVQFSEWKIVESETRMLGESEEVSTWLPMLSKFTFYWTSIDLVMLVAQILRNGRLVELIPSVGYKEEKALEKMLLSYIQDSVMPQLTANNPYQEAVTSIITSNKATLRSVTLLKHMALGFYRNGRLRKFKFLVQPYVGTLMEKLLQAKNCMKALRGQNDLRDLQFEFFSGLDYPPFTDQESQSALEFEFMLSQIISGHEAHFTRINLKLLGHFTWDPVWATDYNSVFSKCNSLKYLKFHYDSMGSVGNSGAKPTFKGIEALPRSLVYFSTDLPIHTTSKNLAELDLSNLPSLQKFKLLSKINNNEWLIFKETSIVQFKVEDVKMLGSKLPNLQTFSLNLQMKRVGTERFTASDRVPETFLNVDTRYHTGRYFLEKYYKWTFNRSNGFEVTFPHL